MSVSIKKEDLETLARAVCYARTVTPNDYSSTSRLLDDARRIIRELNHKQQVITQEQTKKIMELRKNDEKARLAHREAGRRYYQKHKKKTEKKNVKVTKI